MRFKVTMQRVCRQSGGDAAGPGPRRGDEEKKGSSVVGENGTIHCVQDSQRESNRDEQKDYPNDKYWELDKKEFQYRSQEGIEQSKACHSADSGTNDHTGQFSDHEDCHSAGLHQAPPCSGQSIGDVRP